MRIGKKAIRVILFLTIAIFLLALVQKPFRERDERLISDYQGFYREKENSLDAVYIGSSTTYAYWQPIAAWENTGFAVYPITSPSMPPQCLKYLVIEARKTQKDPLFILNLTTFSSANTSTLTVSDIHKAVDYLPFSVNKINMINELTDWADIHGIDKLEFFLPIIRYHDDWINLKPWNFKRSNDLNKGTFSYQLHYKKATDISSAYTMAKGSQPMTDDQNEVLTDLLQFLKEENVNALFVISPGAYGKNKQALERYNNIVETVESEGFPALNLINEKDEIGLDTVREFMNYKHVNIHGAFKFTAYLSNYLKENYDFEDKRGLAEYSSWDEAVKVRTDAIKSIVLDFERNFTKRDNSLSAVVPALKRQGKAVRISWKPVDGADAYHIYRKNGENGSWKRLADLPTDAKTYTDKGLKAGVTYTYTVVASRNEAGTDIYGNCNYAGKSVKVPK